MGSTASKAVRTDLECRLARLAVAARLRARRSSAFHIWARRRLDDPAGRRTAPFACLRHSRLRSSSRSHRTTLNSVARLGGGFRIRRRKQKSADLRATRLRLVRIGACAAASVALLPYGYDPDNVFHRSQGIPSA
jgi:hypothetical protein